MLPQHHIGHGHGPQLHILCCQDPCPLRLRILVELDVLLSNQGPLYVLSLKAQIALHNDQHPGEGQLLWAAGIRPTFASALEGAHLDKPQPGNVVSNQLELALGLCRQRQVNK